MASAVPPAGQSPTARYQPAAARPMVTVASYDDYASAQRAVDFLSDRGFPVNQVSIIGADLRLVERVLGRMTVLRSAGAGAISAAWFGLLIGLLLILFTESGWLSILLVAVLVAAAWGAAFGAIAQAVTGGRRDFASSSSLEAAHYAVAVTPQHAESASQLLAELPPLGVGG